MLIVSNEGTCKINGRPTTFGEDCPIEEQWAETKEKGDGEEADER